MTQQTGINNPFYQVSIQMLAIPGETVNVARRDWDAIYTKMKEAASMSEELIRVREENDSLTITRDDLTKELSECEHLVRVRDIEMEDLKDRYQGVKKMLAQANQEGGG